MPRIASLFAATAAAAAFGANVRDDPDCVNLRDLAVLHAGPVFDSLAPAYASSLNETCKPDDVHDVRKLTLRFRNIIDVFSPVYPNVTGTDGKDIWGNLRKHIDDGYTLMGDFQDLAHSSVNYTEDDLEKRLKDVLEWYADWKLYNYTRGYAAFVKAPPPAQDATYRHSDESGFFWKAVEEGTGSSLFPQTTTGSGIVAVRRLVSAQLQIISNTSAAVANLSSILPETAHDQFHDFRKTLRAVKDESSEFAADAVPIFDANSTDVADALDLIGKLYDKYGDLNDEWNKYDYYKQKGDKSKESDAASKVESAWSDLRKYQDDAGLQDQLTNLANGLTTACSQR